MSETADWTIIVRNSQKAARAAEAALEITQRLETDLSHRLTALEGRFGALEGRMTSVAAGLDSLHRAVLRIADIQDDQTAGLDGQTARLASIETTLALILARLPI
jgi:hypothetical protein